MKLNLTVVREQLKDCHQLQYQTDKDQPFLLKYPQKYQPGMTFRDDVLYIACAEDLPSEPHFSSHVSFIGLGYSPAVYVNAENCEFVCLSSDTDFSFLFQQVLDIFYTFETYNEQFKDMLIRHASPDEFGKLCFSILQNPVSAFGLYEKILFVEYGETLNSDNVTYAGCTGEYLDEEERSVLYADKAFVESLSVRGPALFRSGIYSSSIIHFNIFDKDKYIGRVLVEDTLHPFQDGDYQLLAWIGQHVKQLIHSAHIFHFCAPREFEYLIQELQRYPRIHHSSDQRILQLFGWHPKDTYICTAIGQPLQEQSQALLSDSAYYLREILDNQYIFIQDNIIYQIINLTKSSCSLYEIQRKLRVFKESNALYCSFSTSFSDIYLLPQQLEQARLMLTYAIRKHADTLCEFDQMALPMMLDRISSSCPQDVFLMRSLRELYDYDAANQSDYVHTLRLYLDNHLSLSQTSNALYIARSSLQYRIQRIERILHLNLSDPDIALYLSIALRLQDA